MYIYLVSPYVVIKEKGLYITASTLSDWLVGGEEWDGDWSVMR